MLDTRNPLNLAQSKKDEGVLKWHVVGVPFDSDVTYRALVIWMKVVVGVFFPYLRRMGSMGESRRNALTASKKLRLLSESRLRCSGKRHNLSFIFSLLTRLFWKIT